MIKRTFAHVKSAALIIKEFLVNKDMNESQLARMCKTSAQNMNKKLKKNDIDTAWVARISKAVNHNFFEDLSREWESENHHVSAVSEPHSKYGKNPFEDYLRNVVRSILDERK